MLLASDSNDDLMLFQTDSDTYVTIEKEEIGVVIQLLQAAQDELQEKGYFV